MRSLGPDIRNIECCARHDGSLDIEIPIITHRITEVSIKDDWRNFAAIRHHCGRNCRRSDCRELIRAEKVTNCFQWEIYVVLFKWRITTSIPEQVAENAVMEDTESSPDCGFPITPGIPGKT